MRLAFRYARRGAEPKGMATVLSRSASSSDDWQQIRSGIDARFRLGRHNQQLFMPEKHSRPVPGGRAVWLTERLWKLAKDLPVERVPISSIAELDQNCWFGDDSPPTCRNVAAHARRIAEADLTWPII